MTYHPSFRVPHGVRETGIAHDRVVEFADATLQYADVGSGEPISMIHGTSTVDAVVVPSSLYEPLFEAYRVIRYYRVGYAGSTYVGDGVTVERS